jgi:transposase-like protein
MDKDQLTQWLAEGCSLEEIGRRVGRHPSTVAYWLNRYGLRPSGRDRHAARGGLDRADLARLVDENLTVAEIARRMDRSPTTVRYWLRFHGLSTTRAARLRAGGVQGAARARTEMRSCARHGRTEYVLRGAGYRCRRCASEAVTAYRRSVKRRLVEEAGGACRLCGYDRCIAALEFHHVDPATKRFSLSLKGVARAFATVREEAAKCVLLCSNCHAEVEAGVAMLSATDGRG